MSNSSACAKRRLRSVEQAEAVRRQAGEIYAASREHLLSVARRNAACEADAEEAVQEAFVAFIESYDPAGGAPPLAWLTLVAKRKCWRSGGARRREVGELLPGAEAEAGRLAGSAPEVEGRVVDLEEARARLRGLKPDERSAIGLAAAGYSYGEIAGRRGWTKTKVNRCLYEGRVALREAGSMAG
jgi:DNA-directed RNA polymerase specialized sigma24 family protein